jgi:hypothetical protein
VLNGLKDQMKACPLSQASKPANTHCPIMGGKINAEQIKPELTRQFKGRTIAFCCGGCPDQWDRLSDEQKQAKLGKHETSPATSGLAVPTRARAGHH